MWYNIDIYKFGYHLIYPVLRRKKMYSLIKVLLKPFYDLNASFYAYINNTQLRGGQVCAIEYILNSYFGLLNRDIYLTDIPDQQIYLRKRSEGQIPVYISNRYESENVYLRMRGEGNQEGNYIINVPDYLSDRSEEINRIADKYRPAGRKYKLNIYHYE